MKSGSAYYLRGIISSSLFDNEGKCDVTKYAVFTNVVKYTAWVDKITSQKFARTQFEYVTTLDDGKKYEVYSYRTDYLKLNGTSEASSSTSFKEI